MTDKERWHAVCEDCDWSGKWSARSIAIGRAPIHENDKNHTTELKDLYQTDHRLPDDLRSDGGTDCADKDRSGGVSVYVPDPDQPEPRVVEVEHICVGCGELIRKFDAFEDTVETNVRPIHDSLECRRKAVEGSE